jgi:hypothetical protein
VEVEFQKYRFADELTFKNDIDEIVEEMVYEPEGGINRFSTSGCKRVPNLVRNLIVQKRYLLHEDL